MKVITFHTGGRYLENALELQKSAAYVGLECVLYERPDLGTWWQNCNQKCEVVLEALKQFGDEPILWMDADARFIRYPKLLDEIDADMAAFFYSPTIPIGGVLWFNGRRALRYVEAWAANVAEHPDWEDDSVNFKRTLAGIKNPQIHHLPPPYCWNEKTMRSAYPGVKEPVIIHAYVGKHDYPVWDSKVIES